MAITVDLANLTLLWDGESATGWTGDDTVTTAADIQREDTNCLSFQLSQQEGHAQVTISSTDMTGVRIYVWVRLHIFVDTIANGGIQILIGDGTNTASYYVGGNDAVGFQVGSWSCVMLDTANLPSDFSVIAGAEGSINLAAITEVGVGFDTGSVKAQGPVNNLFWDIARFGTGLIVHGTPSPAGLFADLAADDASLAADKAYGIIREIEPGVYGVQGDIIIGDAAGSAVTDIDETDAIVLLEDHIHPTARGEPLPFKIELTGNATLDTDVTMGTLVGTGDGRQGIAGVTFQNSNLRNIWTFEPNDADVDSAEFYGCTFRGFTGGAPMSWPDLATLIGCTFINCEEVQTEAAEVLNCTQIEPVPDRGLELLSTHDVKQMAMIAGADVAGAAGQVWQVDESPAPDEAVDVTDDFNGVGAGDPGFFPATEAIGDYTLIISVRKYQRATIDMSTVGVGGVVEIEYWDGSAWGTPPGLVDGTANLTANGDITFDLPNDWAADSFAVAIGASGPARDTMRGYAIRFRVTTVYSTNPLIDSTGTSALDDFVEHHVHVPVAGSYTFDALEFFGHAPDGAPKWHVENSSAATSVDSYADTNQDATQPLGNGTIIGTGQALLGTVGVLSSVDFMLSKTLLPTGSIVARLYAHSGVFGTSSIPTGPALATSEPFDAASLDGTLRLKTFEFRDEFTLAAINYVTVLEYSGGDGSNFVNVGTDTSAPSHGGNFSTLTGAVWSAVAGTDAVFEVRRDGIVIIAATNGANPSADEAQETDDEPGATIVNNAVTLTVTIVDLAGAPIEFVRIAIFEDDNIVEGAELMNELTNASGVATEPFNFTSDQDVSIRARKSSASPKLRPRAQPATISVDGLAVTIAMEIDPQA